MSNPNWPPASTAPGGEPQAPPPPGTLYPPGYPYGYMPPAQRATNGMAIASMVLGIIWIYWIGSILALVFGYIAKSQIRESNGTQSGDGMATAGIVLGWIGIGVFTLGIIVFMIAAAASDGGSY